MTTPLTDYEVSELWARVDRYANKAHTAWSAADVLKAELHRARKAESALRDALLDVDSALENAKREGAL